tara:strand:- start:1890 stop:2051 length:162 start_codon:yes stop_codon:yes gene_type:complete
VLNLEKIKKIKFSYFDSNGYIYPFEMIEDSLEFNYNNQKQKGAKFKIILPFDN